MALQISSAAPAPMHGRVRPDDLSARVPPRITLSSQDPSGSFFELGPGDVVVHAVHGLARFEEIELVKRGFTAEDHLRLLLLHDPQCFAYVPPGDADLTLSGHTHGGQVGLVSLGLDWTVLSATRWPDHGLFARGPNRLYVHRGTGFYGFPLRIGVPGEASLLEVLPVA